MNQHELIEKCRMTDEEVEIASAVGREHYCRTHYLSKLPRFNDADKARAAEREVAEAQLRKAIPIIEAEARKAERERVLAKVIHMLETKWGYTEFAEVAMNDTCAGKLKRLIAKIIDELQALKGEGDG